MGRARARVNGRRADRILLPTSVGRRRHAMARTARRKDPKALIHEVFTKESAHMSLEQAVAGFPVAQINTKPPNVPYSFWHILEHIRIAQADLLDYVQKSKHVSPTWP